MVVCKVGLEHAKVPRCQAVDCLTLKSTLFEAYLMVLVHLIETRILTHNLLDIHFYLHTHFNLLFIFKFIFKHE